MKDKLIWTAVVAVLTGLALTTGVPITPEPHEVLPACPSEDSDNCYWDASTRGNGEGDSFYVVDGTVTYIGER